MAQFNQDRTKILVEAGDTLPSIAAQLELKDGGAALLAANRRLIGVNPMILAPGWILVVPDEKSKREAASTEKVNTYVVAADQPLNLRITLQDAEGRPLLKGLSDVGGDLLSLAIAPLNVVKHIGELVFDFVHDLFLDRKDLGGDVEGHLSSIGRSFTHPIGNLAGKCLDGLHFRYIVKLDTKEGVCYPKVEVLDDGLLIKEVPPSTKSGELTIYWQPIAERITLCPPAKQTIHLHIGGLEPIVTPPSHKGYSPGRAVQKILTNLGGYSGDPDGDLSGDGSRCALRKFQKSKQLLPAHGMADAITCKKLVEEQGDRMPEPVAPETAAKEGVFSRVCIQNGAKEAKEPEVPVQIKRYYIEPAFECQTLHLDFNPRLLFSDHAYVAPSYEGKEEENPNVVRAADGEFLFLDVGRWLDDARDFGVIWGRNVYLCEYRRDVALSSDEAGAGTPPPAQGARPDEIFFNALGAHVVVKTYAVADFAPTNEFDWNKLYVILGDFHLMTRDVRSVWTNSDYDLRAELDLKEFTRLLLGVEALKPYLKVIQIGDSYDLWVDCGFGEKENEPLFETDLENRKMKLKQGRFQRKGADGAVVEKTAPEWLCDFISNIQGGGWVSDALQRVAETKPTTTTGNLAAACVKEGPYTEHLGRRNPAETALRLLNEKLGADDGEHRAEAGMIYIYGNHDDYLIDDDLCRQAGIPLRRRYYQGKGIFVEHAHRMEATFNMEQPDRLETYRMPIAPMIPLVNTYAKWSSLDPAPRNFDGDPSGFISTCDTYNDAKAKGDGRTNIGKGGGTTQFKKEIAERWASIHDHREYQRELAQVWLGRKLTRGLGVQSPYPDESVHELKPPHIFVIGHTHCPRLWHVTVDPMRQDFEAAGDGDLASSLLTGHTPQ